VDVRPYSVEPSSDGLEILNRCGAAHIEEILTRPAVASPPPLPLAEMRQGMFDSGTLP
jgi:hypothetical protein